MDLSCLGRTIYAQQFWVPSHRFYSATGEQTGITQTIYTDSQPSSRMPTSLMPRAKLRAQTSHFLRLGVTRSGIEPRPPAPRADDLTTRLRRGGLRGYRGYTYSCLVTIICRQNHPSFNTYYSVRVERNTKEIYYL